MRTGSSARTGDSLEPPQELYYSILVVVVSLPYYFGENKRQKDAKTLAINPHGQDVLLLYFRSCISPSSLSSETLAPAFSARGELLNSLSPDPPIDASFRRVLLPLLLS